MTDPRYCVALVDKPAGPTSFRVAQLAARRFGLRKSGHTGTLDFNVTGLLVVAFDEATKGIRWLVGLDKTYIGAMSLARQVPVEILRDAAARFVGVVTQVPPERAAVKRAPRQRAVRRFEIIAVNGRAAEFIAVVEAGAYIRTLLADLGRHLGVEIVMSSLRRTRVGPFDIAEAAPLEALNAERLIPLESALERVGIPAISIAPAQELKIRSGIPIAVETPAEAEFAGLIGPRGSIVAIAQRREREYHPIRVLAD